jgi:hypothetical protein
VSERTKWSPRDSIQSHAKLFPREYSTISAIHRDSCGLVVDGNKEWHSICLLFTRRGCDGFVEGRRDENKAVRFNRAEYDRKPGQVPAIFWAVCMSL